MVEHATDPAVREETGRDVPAEAFERLRARIEHLGSQWTPSFELDVEAMLREA